MKSNSLYIILSLVKAPLKSCDAVGVKVLSAQEDIANTRLAFANGTICNITASRVSNDVLRKIRIFQKDTYISLDYAAQKITVFKKKGTKIIKKEIVVPKKEPLAEELRSFISCIRKGKQPIVCGNEDKQALKIALKVSRKFRKNG